MTKEECIEFVKNCEFSQLLLLLFTFEWSSILLTSLLLRFSFLIAVSLAMSRDGSSGGTIRLAVITKGEVERIFIPGDKLPTFWEG